MPYLHVPHDALPNLELTQATGLVENVAVILMHDSACLVYTSLICPYTRSLTLI